MLNRRSPLLWLAIAFVLHMGSSLVVAWWLIDRHPELKHALVEATFAAALLAILTYVTVYKILETRVFKKAGKMAAHIRAIAHGENRHIDASKFPALEPLPEAVNVLGGKLVDLRQEMRNQVAQATARAEDEKGRLAAILNDLAEGVVVCNLNHQVVLYNQVALKLLHVSGELGLGRSLFGMLSREPVIHMFEQLSKRPQAHATPFLADTVDSRSLLQARMSLIRLKDEVTGYVISFTDATEHLNALARRDGLLRDLTDGLRPSLGRLSAEVPGNEAVAAMAATVARVSEEWQTVVAGWWPMTDVNSVDLIDYVISRLQGVGITVTMTGLPVWLHGDSHSLAMALEAILRRLREEDGVREVDIEAETSGDQCWLNLLWGAKQIDPAKIDACMAQPLPSALGGLTVRDVLQHHTRQGSGVEMANGRIKLHLPLLPAREIHGDAQAASLPPRPEFFDFDLLAQDKNLTGSLGQKRLRDLTYVVFDTETTGLRPSEGDQIVQIAGVRIVNGRILTGECFDRIVNPGRRIPPESIKFHGITDEMVVDKPPISVVLPQFRAFCADAVLVAHNAAFDLKFIRMRERDYGIRFDNPVLDTMLLSSYVDGSAENQSLDAIAERYGVALHDRHQALGDSLCTAAVLLRLIEGLEERGIHTLDDAVKTLNMTVELHQRAAAF